MMRTPICTGKCWSNAGRSTDTIYTVIQIHVASKKYLKSAWHFALCHNKERLQNIKSDTQLLTETLNSWNRAYCIYSRISRPAYKPTPIDRQPSCWLSTLAVWHNPHISRPHNLNVKSAPKIVGLYASITVGQRGQSQGHQASSSTDRKCPLTRQIMLYYLHCVCCPHEVPLTKTCKNGSGSLMSRDIVCDLHHCWLRKKNCTMSKFGEEIAGIICNWDYTFHKV